MRCLKVKTLGLKIGALATKFRIGAAQVASGFWQSSVNGIIMLIVRPPLTWNTEKGSEDWESARVGIGVTQGLPPASPALTRPGSSSHMRVAISSNAFGMCSLGIELLLSSDQLGDNKKFTMRYLPSTVMVVFQLSASPGWKEPSVLTSMSGSMICPAKPRAGTSAGTTMVSILIGGAGGPGGVGAAQAATVKNRRTART